MKYTIKEIAELTGVTKSTVSKALNGQKGVSEQKRAEIMRLASDYKYMPNAAARSLSKKCSETIGLVISSDSAYTMANPYWMEIIAAVAEETERNNYNLLLLTSSKSAPLNSLENAIIKRALDGVVIPSELASKEMINFLHESGIPFVLQGKSPVSSQHCVDVRNKEGAEELTARLLESGFKKPCCITGPKNFMYCHERAAGFQSELAKRGIKECPILYTPFSQEAAKKNTQEFLEKNSGVDSVFIAGGGDFVLHIFNAMTEFGFDLKKIGFAVFDDAPLLHNLPYHIIAGKQPIRQMGAQDAKILLQLIQGENPPKLSLFDIAMATFQ